MVSVTYIEHSGFMVDLSDKALVFDYYKGEIPKTDKPLYFFASHSHKDHFNKKILDMDCEKYILSDDIKVPENEKTVKMAPNSQTEIDGIKISTLMSTDEGVAFIVEYRNAVIYHAGDLNDWYWEGEDEAWNSNMTKSYKNIILNGFKDIKNVDIAFLPVDPRQDSHCGAGASFFMENVGAKHIFPMHFWGKYRAVEKYAKSRSENIHIITKAPQFFDIEIEAEV